MNILVINFMESHWLLCPLEVYQRELKFNKTDFILLQKKSWRQFDINSRQNMAILEKVKIKESI